MRKEHFRGVLWPHGKVEEGNKTNYRYIICGVLVTDTPLDIPSEFSNESIIDGNARIADGIEGAYKRHPNLPTGDVLNVITSLEIL